MHGNKHMGEISKGWIMDMSEIEDMARAAHDALPDVVVWLKELADRMDTLERYLERAEDRHVMHAREQIEGFFRKYLGRDPAGNELEFELEAWRTAQATMATIEARVMRTIDPPNEEGTKPDDPMQFPEPGPWREPVKSMWLADYDPATDLATWTTLTLMAQPTDTARHAIINRVKAMGGNAIPLYAINYGDFAHTLYREVFYDGSENAMGEWLVWYQHMINLGIEPWVFLMNDDYPHPKLDRKNLAAVKAYWKRLIQDIYKPLQIRHVCPGLEALEYWTPDELNELGCWLKEEMPWAEIGMHTIERDTRCLGQSWVDAIWWQGTFWAPPEAYIADLGALRKQWPEKKIYLMEYSKEGTTDAAQAIGNAGLAWGCAGVLNGWGTGGTPTAGHPDTRAKPAAGEWTAKATNAPWDIGAGIKSLGPVDSGAIHWKQTIALKGVEIFGGKIRFPYSKETPWMQAKQPDGSTSTGNLWCVQNVRGQLYATTIDWLRNPDQQSKDFPRVMQAPGHLLDPMEFRPGESYGFFVSTCARNNLRTTNERSNIVWIRIDNPAE